MRLKCPRTLLRLKLRLKSPTTLLRPVWVGGNERTMSKELEMIRDSKINGHFKVENK